MSEQASRLPGQICTWTGEEWKPLTGPGAEESISEAFGALDTLLTALATLRSIDTSNLAQPESAQQWEENLLAADAADATLALVLEELEAELDCQHSRDMDTDTYRDLDLLDDDVTEATEDESSLPATAWPRQRAGLPGLADAACG